MGVTKDDMARRFINLVDEFYDRSVKLIISAEVELKDLYSGGRLGSNSSAPSVVCWKCSPRMLDASAPALIRGGNEKGLPMATPFFHGRAAFQRCAVFCSKPARSFFAWAISEGFHGVDRLIATACFSWAMAFSRSSSPYT